MARSWSLRPPSAKDTAAVGKQEWFTMAAAGYSPTPTVRDCDASSSTRCTLWRTAISNRASSSSELQRPSDSAGAALKRHARIRLAQRSHVSRSSANTKFTWDRSERSLARPKPVRVSRHCSSETTSATCEASSPSAAASMRFCFAVLRHDCDTQRERLRSLGQIRPQAQWLRPQAEAPLAAPFVLSVHTSLA
eukprot:73572-Pleurochrysis_carterae.AAC.2